MAYLTIQINCPGKTVGDLNAQFSDSTLQHPGMNRLIDFLNALNSGAARGDVQVVVNTASQTIVAAGGGNTADYNLL